LFWAIPSGEAFSSQTVKTQPARFAQDKPNDNLIPNAKKFTQIPHNPLIQFNLGIKDPYTYNKLAKSGTFVVFNPCMVILMKKVLCISLPKPNKWIAFGNYTLNHYF
jgi:hypothetical protein